MTDWVKSGWGYRVSSIDELMLAVARLGMNEIGRRYVWRGCRNATWNVATSIQRYMMAHSEHGEPNNELSVRTLERRIIALARKWDLDIGDGQDHGLLTYLQHHGSPTRLLDVTTDPMTALWFACASASPGKRDTAGAFFAIDVSDASILETATWRLQRTCGSMADNGWYFAYHLRLAAEQNKPFLVVPSDRDARMIAQQGLFLAGSIPATAGVLGLDAFGFPAHEAPSPQSFGRLVSYAKRARGHPYRFPFLVLIIPPALKQSLRLQLATTYNRTESTLFPDYAGLAGDIMSVAPELPDVGPDVRVE